MQNKNKVAVYGSLLKGLHNHNYYLKNAKYIGEFDSDPDYTLYDLGQYPGLKRKGNTSIRMEVYEVDNIQLNKIDTLEGYHPQNKDSSHYNRFEIDTPYGKAYSYEYNPKVNSITKVLSGDWKDHFNTKSLINV